MTEILKISQLIKHDAVPEMDVRCGRIDAKFNIKRPALGQFGKELVAAENAVASLAKTRELIWQVRASSLAIFVQNLTDLLDRHVLVNLLAELVKTSLRTRLAQDRARS